MTRTKYIFAMAAALLLAVLTCGCIEDGITTSAADQPAYSTDTLKMGTVFTQDVTTTHRFVVYNRAGKGLNISSIRMSGPNAGLFRLNVDGISGTEFSNVEVRAKDSIFVMVEATLPANGGELPVRIESKVEFVTNGVTSGIVVTADGQDVERLRAQTVNSDAVFSTGKPYQVFDSLVVAPDATLTLRAGTRLYFHDGAALIVRGRLIAEGTADNPVTLCGDRTGNVITDVTFDLMSRQWAGVQFTPTSTANHLTHTNIRNTVYGVIVSGNGGKLNTPQLYLHNCRLRNSGDLVLEAYDADVEAYGCEFAEAANGVILLSGGTHTFSQCTFANYYLFAAIGGPAIQLSHLKADDGTVNGGGVGTAADQATPLTRAIFGNCIIYGLGQDISHGDLSGTGVYLRHCLLKSNGSDDDNFISCLWDKDPLYYTVREDYLFDYRLRNDSPAIGAGDPTLVGNATTDAYGLPRGATPDLGAYVHVPATE